MTVWAIIQARMSSRRLPGKILRPLAGEPLLGHICRRLAECRAIDGFAVATSEAASDDPTADFCQSRGVRCVRGPLEDVAARFLRSARELGAEALVRINGDSPFVDPSLVDHAVELFRAGGADVVTNISPRSFPKGMSVEVMAVSALSRAYQNMGELSHREHVTKYFYEHPDAFRIINFISGGDFSTVQLSVDTSEDFLRAEQIIRSKEGSSGPWGWKDVLKARDQLLQGKV